MNMKTLAVILIAAYAGNQYLKKARQQRLEAAGTDGAAASESTREARPSRLRQMLDADLPPGVERLRQGQPTGAFDSVAFQGDDGAAHDDLLSPSPQTVTPG